MDNYMWILFFVGMILLLMSSVLQWYCDFGRQALPEYCPRLYNTRYKILLEAGWILLLLFGGALVLAADIFVWNDWYMTVIVIFAYWILLPLSVIPRVRKRLLPRWGDIKKKMEKLDYTEFDYWRGDWWRKKKSKKGKEEEEKEKS